MAQLFLKTIFFFLSLQACKSQHSLTREPVKEVKIESEDTTTDGFFKSSYITHSNYVTSIDPMQYRFFELSKDKKEFIYRYNLPYFIKEVSDTLIFTIDFQKPEKSYYIKKDYYIAYEKYDSVSKKADRRIKLRTDTFDLVFIDSIHTKYKNIIYPIYRFDSYTGDFECNTFFVNDSMGVFKRYGEHYSDCVEQHFQIGQAKYELLVHLINQLQIRKDFHKACPVTKLWTAGDKLPNQKK